MLTFDFITDFISMVHSCTVNGTRGRYNVTINWLKMLDDTSIATTKEEGHNRYRDI